MTETGGLTVDSLRVSYAEAETLFGVSLGVTAGRALAVLGANGAGKSTLARAVAGLVKPIGGTVVFDDQDITGWPAHRTARAGLAYIPEGRGIFPGLSVTDNLAMAVGQLRDKQARRQAVAKAVDLFPVLGQRRSQRSGSLSGGEQQMLALARAFIAAPKLIIADEMSLGLAPRMVDMVFAVLERIRVEGITIVLIEQFVSRALAFADDCVIMKRGVVAWTGPASSAGEAVLAQYMGEAPAEI